MGRQVLNLREDVVVEELQDDGHDDTEDGGDQRHLHITVPPGSIPRDSDSAGWVGPMSLHF